MKSPARALSFATDMTLGLRRLGPKTAFRYVRPSGGPVRDRSLVQRIKSLAIPPAWTEVWIAEKSNAHLQATGRDVRGRKQYIYHPRFRELQEATKFDHLTDFATGLPTLRARVAADMRKHGLPREKVIATVVALLEFTLIRVGNAAYAETNKSYGLTTFENRHAVVAGDTVRFSFKGKSGRVWRLKLKDRRIARTIRAVHDLPGQHLFQYLDDAGDARAIGSGDINDYLRSATKREITAKDFRTWAGTLETAVNLSLREPALTEKERNHAVREVTKGVANRLGNTPTVCRKSYIHPAVIDLYMRGELAPALASARRSARRGLTTDEAAVVAILRRRASGHS